MILICPNCGTQYFAADAQSIGEGQTVRCQACGTEWQPDPPAATAASEKGAHEVYLARKRARAARARSVARITAWSVVLLLAVGVVVGSGLYRNEIVRYWPQSATAFNALGLDVNRFGLEPRDISPKRTFNGTTPVLTITGRAENITRVDQPAPLVRIGLLDEFDNEITVETVSLDRPSVPARGSAGFEVLIDNAPVEAYRLDISFVRPAGGEESAHTQLQFDAAPNPPAAATQSPEDSDTEIATDPGTVSGPDDE